ncbi:enoyl-CoA hydratase/isomerase family protein [Gordonia polyisoprenivorans]|uniref:enoyl-CoA hydratase/isomerase family protein n=1 Tax=Gordonia polyisoprenivorans TaxID=84595 RepID=UPI001AD715C3|nr:enoyl-CoA hydratase/isomerase family protein [Gordonia polyisoprenivorans]QTI70974.1 enoyl-CoA hydratase/isomerase family protein [Gordonia polyisoprenivorans]
MAAADANGGLLVTDRDAARVLTLNRPEVLNAIDPQLGSALHAALVAADADPSVRCIVLTATGSRAFSAGGDLKKMARTDGPTIGGASHAITEALQHRPGKPMIAAVNGLAYGGGLVRLPRLVGERRARQMILSGAPAPVDASTALEWASKSHTACK